MGAETSDVDRSKWPPPHPIPFHPIPSYSTVYMRGRKEERLFSSGNGSSSGSKKKWQEMGKRKSERKNEEKKKNLISSSKTPTAAVGAANQVSDVVGVVQSPASRFILLLLLPFFFPEAHFVLLHPLFPTPHSRRRRRYSTVQHGRLCALRVPHLSISSFFGRGAPEVFLSHTHTHTPGS